MSKQTALLAERLERRRHVALRQSSRGQEHLVESERSEGLYLVIRDRASHFLLQYLDSVTTAHLSTPHR